MSSKDRLYYLCRKFIEQNQITCAEAIYQNDLDTADVLYLLENICEIVGYERQAVSDLPKVHARPKDNVRRVHLSNKSGYG